MTKNRILAGPTSVVFEDEEYDFNFPSLEKLSDGSLTCVARKIKGLSDPLGRIAARRSFDGGRTWEDMLTPACHDEKDFPEKGFLCPSICEVAPGELVAIYLLVDTMPGKPLFHPETDGMQYAHIRTTKSFDSGISWKKPHDLEFTLPDIMVPGKGRLLRDGTFGFPVEVHHEWDKGFREGPSARLVLSHDKGETFPQAATIAMKKGNIYGDARHTVDESGNIIMYFWRYNVTENKDMAVHKSMSRDCGRTWEDPYAINLHMQITSPLYFRKGVTMCLCQDRFSDTPGLKTMLSYDEGMNWDADTCVQVFSAGSKPSDSNPFKAFDQFKFGYSSLLKTGENSAMAVYWHSGEKTLCVSVTSLTVE